MSVPSFCLARSAVAIAAACCLPAATAASDAAAIRAIVDAAIHPVMARHQVPGMAVAVTVDGATHVYNYGLASKEDKTPVTDATLFELGSVSKPMTATLASYAVVLGKLSLDEHPGKYMPSLRGSAIDKASVLHLGTYTAGGLPMQFPENLKDSEMSDWFRQWKPEAAPGVQRRYSNPSLGLFGHVAALSLDGDFTDLMEQRIFAPLGMKGVHIRIPDSARQHYAWGYDRADKPVRKGPDVFSAQTYGVVATAGGVMRFVQANMDPGKVAGPLGEALKGTQHAYYAVGAMRQGLGWEQYRYPVALDDLVWGNSAEVSQRPNSVSSAAVADGAQGDILFNKTGATRGFSNYVAFVPARKIGVVLLANKGYPAQARVAAAHAILAQLDRGAVREKR